MHPQARRTVASAFCTILCGSLFVAFGPSAPAQAAKVPDRFVGFGAGGLGGQFNAPGDVAVNEDGTGGASAGDVYVADTGNQRIAVYAATGAFKFAFGRDVIAPGMAGDLGFAFEKCADIAACQAGSQGSLGGEFANPQGVAVDQVTGDVFVRDRDNLRVQQFTATGAFVRAWGWNVVQMGGAGDDATPPLNEFEICINAVQCQTGATGAGNGQFATNSTTGTGIAIAGVGAPSAGHVFVVDPGNRRVQEFDLSLAPASLWVRSFGSAGTGVGQFNTNMPQHVAVDTIGNVYGSDTSGAGRINRYTATGANLTPIAAPPLLAGGTSTTSTSGLELDPDSDGADPGDVDRLYVLRNPSSGNTIVQQFDNPAATDVTTPTDSHALTAIGTSNANGLGLNSTTGRLYVSLATGNACGGAACHGVLVLDDDGTSTDIDALQSGVTDIGSASATLNGSLATPDGLVNYRFEYSREGVNWNRFVDRRVSVAGSQDVSAPATDLEAGRRYHVRLVATKVITPTSAVSDTSAESTFYTDPAPPVAESVGAQQVTDATARLSGRVHPGGLSTSYWFEWGDNRYGNVTPSPAGSAGDGGVAKLVGADLAGLVPRTTYHFRVCASNALSSSAVCGADRSFTTSAPIAAPPGRAYEMVTAPDKALRRGGDIGNVRSGNRDRDEAHFQSALPAPDGGATTWSIFAGVTDPSAGHGFAYSNGHEIPRRHTGLDWISEAVVNVPPKQGADAGTTSFQAVSSNLKLQAWAHAVSLFDSKTRLGIRVMGSNGGPLGAGWWPALDPAWYAGSLTAPAGMTAVADDGGSLLVSFNAFMTSASPADGGAAPNGLVPAQTTGTATFVVRPPEWHPVDLVNECTGGADGSAPTELPARDGSGQPSDVIAVRECAAGSPTSPRGGSPGAKTSDARLGLGSTATAVSAAGDRVFFLSPDPGGGAPSVCNGGTGASTECPPQLFVRQYDDVGHAVVRWLSRAEGSLFAAPQQIGMMGGGVSFEGASLNGGVVYFRTNAPLTADDPNGGGSTTNGDASPHSWDLYRYELPGDNNIDPSGGTLTRISGGPLRTGDPNTNCPRVATSGADTGRCATTLSSAGALSTPNGGGTVVRFMSDDGERVYFVTAGQIPGATNTPPENGATLPTALDAQVNAASRNLYLYDNSKSGADAYRFIARIPFAIPSSRTGGGSVDACASSNGVPAGPGLSTGYRAASWGMWPNDSNCMHGTGSGDAIVFQSRARLTVDDADDAIDVYLYDLSRNVLVRVSAPPTTAEPYSCVEETAGVSGASCNGDLGMLAGYFDVDIGNQPGGGAIGQVGRRHANIGQDADGHLRAVYFESRLPLVKDDANGDSMDVYEWRDGRLGLISPGATSDSAFYSGNSLDGESVFFWTEQALDTRREVDPADGDIYVARVGGGMPPPPEPPPVCAVLAGGCQGGDFDSLVGDTKTSAPQGTENVTSGARKKLSVYPLSRKARKKASRTGRFTLSVRTSSTARVSLTVRAKLGKRVARVGGASKRVGKAGTVKLSVRLSPAARKRLRSGKSLRLTVEVRQSGTRARTTSILLPGVKS